MKNDMNIKYRRGMPEDLDRLVSFVDNYMTDYFMPKSKIDTILTGGNGKNRWSTKPSIVWLALDGDEIIGIAFISNLGVLWNVLVKPDYRRQGIGKHLLEISNPKKVRCKWDMCSGDPTEFYLYMGYGKMGEHVNGKDGEHGKRTKSKSIQIMIKGGKIPSLNEYA